MPSAISCACVEQAARNRLARHLMSASDNLIVIGTGGAAMPARIEARERVKTVLLGEHGRDLPECRVRALLAAARAAGHRHAATNPFPSRRPAAAESTGPRSSRASSSSSTGCGRRSTRRPRRPRISGPLRPRPVHRRPNRGRRRRASHQPSERHPQALKIAIDAKAEGSWVFMQTRTAAATPSWP